MDILQEIKRKEESGEPLEWELQLVSKDQDTLKVIYDVLAQRQEIEVYAKQAEKPELFLKDLKELSLENSTLKEKLEEKDLKIAELYLKLSKAEGKLNRYMNHVKMNLDREL